MNTYVIKYKTNEPHKFQDRFGKTWTDRSKRGRATFEVIAIDAIEAEKEFLNSLGYRTTILSIVKRSGDENNNLIETILR